MMNPKNRKNKTRMSLPDLSRASSKDRSKSKSRDNLDEETDQPLAEKPRRRSMMDVLFGKSRSVKNEDGKKDKKGFKLLGLREERESKRWKAHETVDKQKHTRQWVEHASRQPKRNGKHSESESDEGAEYVATGSDSESDHKARPRNKKNTKTVRKNAIKAKKSGRSKPAPAKESSDDDKKSSDEEESSSDDESEEVEDEESSEAGESEREGISRISEKAFNKDYSDRTLAKYKKNKRYYIASTDAIIRTYTINKARRAKTPPPTPEDDVPVKSFPRNYSGKRKDKKGGTTTRV